MMNRHLISKFAKARCSYLEQVKPDYYEKLKETGKLYHHCEAYSERAFAVSFQIQEKYQKQNPAPVEFMERLQYFTMIQQIGDEIAMNQVILEQ